MGHGDTSLHWKSESIATIMRDNGIGTRRQLAVRLGRFGISYTTVYRVFSDDWGGEATAMMLAVLAQEFRVALAQLVFEPFQTKESA